MRLSKSVLGFLGILLILCCSAMTCQQSLDPQGVYQGQKFWYSTDTTLVEAKADIDAFLVYAMNNRAELQHEGLQRVTATADTLCTNAPQWFMVAYKARNEYTNALFSGVSPQSLAARSNDLLSAVSQISSNAATARSLTH